LKNLIIGLPKSLAAFSVSIGGTLIGFSDVNVKKSDLNRYFSDVNVKKSDLNRYFSDVNVKKSDVNRYFSDVNAKKSD